MTFLRRLGATATFAFLVAALPCVARAEPPAGALYLSTLPAGANVWIDGTYVGRSPVLVDPIARGRHALTLTKSGWSVLDVDVEISAGTTAMASFRLHAPHASGSPRSRGSVALRGLSDAARVAIDGDPVARMSQGVLPLAAGTHVAVVTTPSGKVARTFTVYPDMTTQVLLSDAPADERPSAIVAPAEEFLPNEAYTVAGKRIVLRYGGHEVIARLGETPMRFDGVTVSYDAPPARINGRLYLPLALLTRLTETKAK